MFHSMLVIAAACTCCAASAQDLAQDPPTTLPLQQPAKIEVLWHTPLRAPSFGSAATADVDGDGRLEIAFATYFGDSAVYVLNGEDGTELWKHQGGGESGVGECLDASLKFADITGDGALELIVPVSNSSLVHAFNAATGKLKWTYEAGLGECIDTPPTITDTDGDGKPEVIVGTFMGRLHIIEGATGAADTAIKVAPGAVQSGATVMDLNGDGTMDYVAANFKGDHRVHAVSGRFDPAANNAVRLDNGVFSIEEPNELWHVQTGGHMYHGCSVGDLDQDGTPELVIASYDGFVYAIRAKDGSLLWKADLDERYIMAPTTIVDVDGDGSLEVVATSDRLTVINADGTIRYSKRIMSRMRASWGISRGVAVADLDGDSALDFVFADGFGVLRVVRGHDGELLYEYDPAELHQKTLGTSSHCPIIADFNGDGRLDVFYVIGGANTQTGEYHGRAICLTGFEGAGDGWRMFRHDLSNTGNHAAPLER